MKTQRLREQIVAFLAERPRNTSEILKHVNASLRHGTTSQQLGNVLAKDASIVKVGWGRPWVSPVAVARSACGRQSTGCGRTRTMP